MLNWANQFDICCFFDSHNYNLPYGTYECLLGAGSASFFLPSDNILPQLDAFCKTHNDWLFGHVGYDLKNETECVLSKGTDRTLFPVIFLFQPCIVIEVNDGTATISSLTADPAEIFGQITEYPLPGVQTLAPELSIKPLLNKSSYIDVIQKLRGHILRGDCYEINFCQEFFAENAIINPLAIYNELVQLSPNPFCCYYKLDDRYLLCASPERYIKKQGDVIVSQPIKGTSKRSTGSEFEDKNLREGLRSSPKDRSENVMVVDLVRNDLSKVCREGTVMVEELFGVYSFPQVHQMTSTVKGVLESGTGFANVLRATFPMGSMTGAPKKRVMELIEQYEPSCRGIFSGSVGYITPGGDFDFNVVIRSIIYNAQTRFLRYLVGGGITFYSDPEKEYEECLLKALAIEKVLERQ